MIAIFQTIHPCSPVEQEFIWHAEYEDQTSLTEYDFETKIENSFNDIKKDSLVRFGLVGQGQRYYFEVNGGIFKIAGKMYEFSYVENDREHALTGQQYKYNDIASFKNAEMYIDPISLETVVDATITDYTFGYKSVIEDKENNLRMHFKALCTISYDNPMYMNVRLVPSRDCDGELIIKRNGQIVDRIPSEFKKNVARELNWIIQ